MKTISPIMLALVLLMASGCRQTNNLSASGKPSQSVSNSNPATTRSPAGQAATARKLVHLVWFSLKADANEESLIAELRKLEAIDVVRDLQIGRFADVDDPRAMSDMELMMGMAFDSVEDYHTYQQHPVHLKLKEQVGAFLDAPPVTYDYWTVPDDG